MSSTATQHIETGILFQQNNKDKFISKGSCKFVFGVFLLRLLHTCELIDVEFVVGEHLLGMIARHVR